MMYLDAVVADVEVMQLFGIHQRLRDVLQLVSAGVEGVQSREVKNTLRELLQLVPCSGSCVIALMRSVDHSSCVMPPVT